MQEFSISKDSDKLQEVLQNLRKNNMAAQYVASKVDVAPAVSALLQKGDRIAVGGSVTLEETQVLDLIRGDEYQFIDRYEPGLTATLQKERLIQAFSADVFLCSANAITMDGEIYQVDGLRN